MCPPVTLALSGDQHERLKRFLFPGDGNEAVAILLCGRRSGDRCYRLVVRDIHDIPYEDCLERTPMASRGRQTTWRRCWSEPLLKVFRSLKSIATRRICCVFTDR